MQGLEEDFERELKQCFVQEATELLEKVERQLLEFEQDTFNPDTLAALFRTAHTFKGSGLSAGFQELGNFCHSLENLLDRLRKQQIAATPKVLDTLLLGFDLVKEVVQGLQEDWKATGFEKIPPNKLEQVLAQLANPESETFLLAQRSAEPENTQKATSTQQPGGGAAWGTARNERIARTNTRTRANEQEQEIQIVVSQIRRLDNLRKANLKHYSENNADSANNATQPQTNARLNAEAKVYQFLPYLHKFTEINSSQYTPQELQCFARKAFSAEDIAVIAQIVILQQTGELHARPAKKLLEVLRTHPIWSETDRLCLARRIGHSRQLQIFDAYTIDATLGETLTGGYSCFVSKNTSLLQVPDHHMRIFKNVEEVLEGYKVRRQPVQRSIAKIFAERLKSGVCAPITIEDHTVGLLFLNSRKPCYFANVSSNSLNLIEFIVGVAQHILTPLAPYSDSQYRIAYEKSPFHDTNNVLNIEELRHEIKQMFFGRLSIQVENKLETPFLVSRFNLAFVVQQLVLNSGWLEAAEVASTTNSLLLVMKEQNKKLQLTLSCYEDQSALQRQIVVSNEIEKKYCLERAAKLLYEVEKINPNEWQLTTTLETVEKGLQDVDYSV